MYFNGEYVPVIDAGYSGPPSISLPQAVVSQAGGADATVFVLRRFYEDPLSTIGFLTRTMRLGLIVRLQSTRALYFDVVFRFVQ